MNITAYRENREIGIAELLGDGIVVADGGGWMIMHFSIV